MDKKIIKAQNKRIEQQIEKVLQLAQSEKNKFTFQKESVDVHEVIREVTKSFEFVISESGGKLEMELNANPSIIKADKSSLFVLKPPRSSSLMHSRSSGEQYIKLMCKRLVTLFQSSLFKIACSN